MTKEKKYYVVWRGRIPGVYDNWTDCKQQVGGFAAARYKSFPSAAAAQEAFQAGNPLHSVTRGSARTSRTARPVTGYGLPIKESICVDAAWNTFSGDMEYQGIYYKTGGLIFKQGPFAEGTNNIGEFLAIVHALGYCKHKNLLLPIYSDSRTAIGWVKKKKANTQLEKTPRNAALFDMVERAEQWLKDNTARNPLLKWETKAWGENPADFGRK